MKRCIIVLTITLFFETILIAQNDSIVLEPSIQEKNKELALKFYEDLWFNNRTDNYKLYVADNYIAHDTGDRKGVIEPAIQQKEIADRFWNSGELTGKIDYQIAEGDLVATRWKCHFEANTVMGRLFEMDSLPIINVMRFENGKIVEIWNHRHDIDTNQTLVFTIKGFLIGLLIALIPTIVAIRFKRKLKKAKS